MTRTPASSMTIGGTARRVLAAVATLGLACALTVAPSALANEAGAATAEADAPAAEQIVTAPQVIDYLGWWCDEQAADKIIWQDGLIRLEISAITDDHVIFSLYTQDGTGAYAVGASGAVAATFGEDGVATATFCDSIGTVYDAKLALQPGQILLDVEAVDVYDANNAAVAATLETHATLARDQHPVTRLGTANLWGGQILPQSAQTALFDYDVLYLMPAQLQLAKDEIYARHGCIFDDPLASEWFASQGWYVPTTPLADFDASQLTETEALNVSNLTAWLDAYEALANGSGFVGVSGAYAGITEGLYESHLTVAFEGDDGIALSVTRMVDGQEQVLLDGARGTIVSDTMALVPVDGCVLVATWGSPGSMTISCRSGVPSPEIAGILRGAFASESYSAAFG